MRPRAILPVRMNPIPPSPTSSIDPPRCRRCQQIIGVYEPAVALDGGTARRTSRAADPERWRSAAGIEHYHLACYEPSIGERLDWSNRPAA